MKEYTEKIQEVEIQFNQLTEECSKLSKELQSCKEEYDSYERKDIQYHENMKAQKSSHKKLRNKRDSNEKEIEEKKSANERMENSLIEYDEAIQKAKEEKEEKERQLSAILEKYKEEIDRLKARRVDIETILTPLQSRYSTELNALEELKTEYEMLNHSYLQASKEVTDLTAWMTEHTAKVWMSLLNDA